MKYTNFIYSILLSVVIMCAFPVKAQNAQIVDPLTARYDQASELFQQARYAAAEDIFDEIAKGQSSVYSEIAEYYAALCAARLTHPDAIARLEKFVTVHPQNALANDANYEIGALYFNNKDFRKTLDAFQKVDMYELSSDKLMEYQFKSAYSYFKLDNLNKARELFVILKDRPNKYNVPATYYYGYIAYKQQQYETALLSFNKVSNDEVYGEMVSQYLVQIYAMQGNYENVIETSKKVLAAGDDKQNAEIIRLVADAYFHQSNYAEAIKNYKRYLATNPAKVSRLDYYGLALSYYRTNDYNQSIKFMQNVATGNDSLAQSAYYILGDSYIKTDQKRFAYNSFFAAQKIKADPKIQEDALLNYAKLAIDLSYNPYNEAVKAIQDFISAYPKSEKVDEFYGYLADLYMLTKNYQDALESIQQIKKRTPRIDAAQQRISYFRGVELFNEQNFTKAIDNFNTARDLNTDKAIAAASQYWAGECYYRMNKWDKAAKAFSDFQTMQGAARQPFYDAAAYHAGYCYFKLKSWSQAAASFRKYINSTDDNVKMKGDASLRIADCFFMIKDYSQAINFYKKAIDYRVTDADYATFQMAMAYGVTGDLQQKINLLSGFPGKFPRSAYSDDAVFETGTSYSLLNDDANAISYFQRVAKEYPQSTFVKKSLLKTGLIYFNQDKNSEALSVLQQVSLKYPGTPEAREALASIKSIYVELDDVDGFVEFTKKVPDADISRSEQDSLQYIVAENQYMSGDCDKAIASFGKYLARFPEGAFMVQANFYKAECENRSGYTDEALRSYGNVLDQGRTRYTATAAAKSAKIYFEKANYNNALDKYIQLEETAEMPNQTIDAVYGQMMCNYNLKKYALAIQAAQKLLAQPNITENLIAESHYTIGKSAYELGNKTLAYSEFEETVNHSFGEKGAEAKFYLAFIDFNDKNYDKAENECFALANDFGSSDYWVAKGYILLADVYTAKADYFQAKQTLQSIIDNYEGADLKQVAQDKLNAINAIEGK